MALTTFTPSPDPTYGPSSYEAQAKILKAPFGDNYNQRVRAGLNHLTRTWSLTWENLTDVEANAIEAFFEARGGDEAFWWTPNIVGSTAMKFICERWNRTPVSHKAATVTATLERVFDHG
jgi:phage-related protein